jgi:hypothetical protein
LLLIWNNFVMQRESQTTKWIIELVAKVDDQYKQEVSQQQQQIVSVLTVCHSSNSSDTAVNSPGECYFKFGC